MVSGSSHYQLHSRITNVKKALNLGTTLILAMSSPRLLISKTISFLFRGLIKLMQIWLWMKLSKLNWTNGLKIKKIFGNKSPRIDGLMMVMQIPLTSTLPPSFMLETIRSDQLKPLRILLFLNGKSLVDVFSSFINTSLKLNMVPITLLRLKPLQPFSDHH